jgi:hypothetical protein
MFAVGLLIAFGPITAFGTLALVVAWALMRAGRR